MSGIFIRNQLINSGNPFYNQAGTKSNAVAKAILGEDAYGNCDPGLNTLPNCVGCAIGAFNETVSRNLQLSGWYYDLSVNAYQMIERAISYYGHSKHEELDLPPLEIGAPDETPSLGSIMVWKKEGVASGHCAYVCNVDSTDKVTVLEASWHVGIASRSSHSIKPYYRVGTSFYSGEWNQKKDYTSIVGTWGYRSSNGTYNRYLGCIKNPIVEGGFITDTPYAVVGQKDGNLDVRCGVASISSVNRSRWYLFFTIDDNQVDSTTLKNAIHQKTLVSNPKIKVYDQQSDFSSTYYIEIDITNKNKPVVVQGDASIGKDAGEHLFKLTIPLPPNTNIKSVTTVPIQVGTDSTGAVLFTNILTGLTKITDIVPPESYVNIGTKTDDSIILQSAIPYIYYSKAWRVCKPMIYSKGLWRLSTKEAEQEEKITP